VFLLQFDWRHALQLGTVDKVSPHNVAEPGPLSITLQWKGELSSDLSGDDNISYMQSPVVRGAPYITMEYYGLQPMIYARQEVTKVYNISTTTITRYCANAE
jgi:Glycosyl hydrolase family 81 N-terminal domain